MVSVMVSVMVLVMVSVMVTGMGSMMAWVMGLELVWSQSWVCYGVNPAISYTDKMS